MGLNFDHVLRVGAHSNSASIVLFLDHIRQAVRPELAALVLEAGVWTTGGPGAARDPGRIDVDTLRCVVVPLCDITVAMHHVETLAEFDAMHGRLGREEVRHIVAEVQGGQLRRSKTAGEGSAQGVHGAVAAHALGSRG